MPEKESPDEQNGATSEVIINGVDMNEALAAHQQHPVLSRWHQTSIRLIPDIYELLERANQTIAELRERIEELEPENEPAPAAEERPG